MLAEKPNVVLVVARVSPTRHNGIPTPNLTRALHTPGGHHAGFAHETTGHRGGVGYTTATLTNSRVTGPEPPCQRDGCP